MSFFSFGGTTECTGAEMYQFGAGYVQSGATFIHIGGFHLSGGSTFVLAPYRPFWCSILVHLVLESSTSVQGLG